MDWKNVRNVILTQLLYISGIFKVANEQARQNLVHPIPHGLSDPHASTAGEAVGRCCQRRVGGHGTVLAEGGLGTG